MAKDSPPPVSSPAAASRGLALIVDDEPTNCRLLGQMLRREGFATVEAYNGLEAIALFKSQAVDIIFMDVMMPEMDGFEATRHIKAISGPSFIPVIFLTALRDEASLVRCTEAGGDDFLSKPFSFAILKARIRAMERVRDLQRTVAKKNQFLSTLLERDREEQELAERVFTRAVNTSNVAQEHIRIVQKPAEMFSGDLVLTQHLVDGGLRILVGDFTGHGLAAAIGALPVSEIFHAMTRKGSTDLDILSEINRKLYQMLPADRFMAACLISIPAHGHELYWWNGGMPSAWLHTENGLIELASHELPLGILPQISNSEPPRRLPIAPGDHLLLMSDGLIEADNQDGEQFDAKFRTIIGQWTHGQSTLPPLLAALQEHTKDINQQDDIAVVEVPLNDKLFYPLNEVEPESPAGWSWFLTLRDQRLTALPAIQEALEPLQLLNGLEAHVGALQTIITELFTNALEHGLLKLDSRMKSTPEGFESYYMERAQRLQAYRGGMITLQLDFEPNTDGGQIHIRVSDNGSGFSEQDIPSSPNDPGRPWGRGIALVRDLCQSVVYSQGGTVVDAYYSW